jgi:hypothetical protein
MNIGIAGCGCGLYGVLLANRLSSPPWPLFPAIISTQLIATLIVVYGIILPSIRRKLALFVWGYALSWFIFNDLVKLGAYRIFEHGWFGKKHLERIKTPTGSHSYLHK